VKASLEQNWLISQFSSETFTAAFSAANSLMRMKARGTVDVAQPVIVCSVVARG
jgi:hypothetical protein